MVGAGDILTFQKGPHTRVIQITALGSRRGPAPEAQSLYTDLAPIPEKAPETAAAPKSPAVRDPGSGRPTKAERRATEKFLSSWDE